MNEGKIVIRLMSQSFGDSALFEDSFHVFESVVKAIFELVGAGRLLSVGSIGTTDDAAEGGTLS